MGPGGGLTSSNQPNGPRKLCGAVTGPLHATGLTVAWDATGPWCAADVPPVELLGGRHLELLLHTTQHLRKGPPHSLRRCSEGWGLPPPGACWGRSADLRPAMRLIPRYLATRSPSGPQTPESASAWQQEPRGIGCTLKCERPGQSPKLGPREDGPALHCRHSWGLTLKRKKPSQEEGGGAQMGFRVFGFWTLLASMPPVPASAA